MANDYLISKWKIWYKSLDVNHDGKISIEDVEESRDKFSDLHKLDPAKAKLVKDNFGGWWNTYIFRGQTGEISEDDFVKSLSNDYAKDKAAFRKNMEKCFDLFFDVIDTNKDRSISEDEFLIAFKAYGHEQVAADQKFFKAYCPADGLVPLRQIVDSWICFVCDDAKPSAGEVVKSAFEAGA